MNNTEREEKKNKIVLIIVGIVLVLLAVSAVIFIALSNKKTVYEVKVTSGEGVLIKDIVVKDNIIKSLPEVTPPKGKKFVVWVNRKNEAVRNNIELEENDTISPVYRDDNRETVKLKFETGTSEKIDDITIIKGSQVILPVKPREYNDWEFLGWINKDGYIVLIDTYIEKDTTLYAYWRKPAKKSEKVTVNYETDTVEKIDSIVLVKGSNYLFPTPSMSMEGKVFRGWKDPSGKLLSKDDIVQNNVTLTAYWVEPYTCPENCEQNEDLKTCTRTLEEEPNRISICHGTERYGRCYDTENLSCEEVQSCSEGDLYNFQEIGVPIDEYFCCAKKIPKEEKIECPEGYEYGNLKCTKLEILECTSN